MCGEPHNANTKHSRDQVTATINRLKQKHPKALLTIEDLAAVVEMPADGGEQDENVSSEDVRWAEEVVTDDDEDLALIIEPGDPINSDLDHMLKSDARRVEAALANSAFIQRRSYTRDMTMALTVVQG